MKDVAVPVESVCDEDYNELISLLYLLSYPFIMPYKDKILIIIFAK